MYTSDVLRLQPSASAPPKASAQDTDVRLRVKTDQRPPEMYSWHLRAIPKSVSWGHTGIGPVLPSRASCKRWVGLGSGKTLRAIPTDEARRRLSGRRAAAAVSKSSLAGANRRSRFRYGPFGTYSISERLAAVETTCGRTKGPRYGPVAPDFRLTKRGHHGIM
jgi:hypothetical protein